MKKLRPDEISSVDDGKVKLGKDVFSVIEISDSFEKLDLKQFNEKYCLSVRAGDKLIKLLNLHKAKHSQLDVFLSSIDADTFVSDYRTLLLK